MEFIIIAVAGLITFILFVSGKDSHRRLFYIGLASIAVGHRSIYVGQVSYFVPLEIITFLLFGVMFTSAILTKERSDTKIPWLLTFVTLWIVGRALISWAEGSSWDNIVAWTAPLVLGLPTFWVIRRLITREYQLAVTIKILLGVSAVMSILALLEYQFPGVARLLPRVFSGKYILTQDGFVRASFGFWGYPAGAIIVTWGMLIAYSDILTPGRSRSLWINIGLFVLGGLAVYISGQRSSWIGLIIAVLVLSISKRWKGGVGIFAIFIIISLLPAVFWSRFDTITNYAKYGVVSDTSIGQRLLRWSWGWNTMMEHPIGGVGYGHWLTHNAFLEIGSTIGILAAIAFLVFFIQLIWRIASLALHGSTPEARRYAWLFLSIAVTWVMQINVETVFQTPPLAVGFWPYIALGWYLPDLFKEVPIAGKPQPYRRPFR